jgi:hypothetical protein
MIGRIIVALLLLSSLNVRAQSLTGGEMVELNPPGSRGTIGGVGIYSPISQFAQVGQVTASGGTASRTLGNKLGDQLSLLDFGAVCDGTTDDSAAINAAMATVKRILIPSGLTCNGATIPQAQITTVFVGPGQIKTSDGNLHGPVVSQMRAAPSVTGSSNILQMFNGTLTNVPYATEQRVTGAATLGQPTTGYKFTNEASAYLTGCYTESGWNNSTGPAGPTSGRTGAACNVIDLYHNGQGDYSAFFASVSVSGPNKAGATSFTANPSGQILSGAVSATHAGVYLEALGDINLIDNGYDVGAIGSVINLDRTNATGALGATWIGYRVQNGGTQQPDAAFSAGGGYKMGLDLVDAFGTTAAVAMSAGQRIYGNGTQPNASPYPSTVALGTEWTDYSATNGWEFYIGSVQVAALSAAITQFNAHIKSGSTVLTSANLSGCGTGPSISTTATDTKGTITQGATATGCTLTFASAYITAPDCVVSSPNGAALTGYTPSTTALVITNASATGDKFSYVCVQ